MMLGFDADLQQVKELQEYIRKLEEAIKGITYVDDNEGLYSSWQDWVELSSRHPILLEVHNE